MTGSPKLKAAMAEIEKVLKKHDIMGTVFLADGLGMGEYLFHWQEPSWSMFRFLLDKKTGVIKGAHTKMHMSSKKEETEMTVNSLFIQRDLIGNAFLKLDAIINDWKTKVEIVEDRGEFLE